MTPNETIIRVFAEQFTPALQVIKTERVNNVRIVDAWQASYWDTDKGIGITAVAHSSQLHAYLEAAGEGSIAEHAGKAIAQALGLFSQEVTKEG